MLVVDAMNWNLICKDLIKKIPYLICVTISMILVLVLNGCFLQQAVENLPVMALVEELKRHVAKRSLQKSLNNQILETKSHPKFM